jgi:hypothetical protein
VLPFPNGLVATPPPASTRFGLLGRELFAQAVSDALANSPSNNVSALILGPLTSGIDAPDGARASRLPAKLTPALDEEGAAEGTDDVRAADLGKGPLLPASLSARPYPTDGDAELCLATPPSAAVVSDALAVGGRRLGTVRTSITVVLRDEASSCSIELWLSSGAGAASCAPSPEDGAPNVAVDSSLVSAMAPARVWINPS